MVPSPWWHGAAAVTVLVLGAAALTDGATTTRSLIAFGATVGLAIGWAACTTRSPLGATQKHILIALLFGVAVLGTSAVPSFAFIQAFGMPLLWVLAGRVRTAIIRTTLFAVAIAGALVAGRQPGEARIIEVALLALITIAFTVAMGLWINQVAGLSEQRRILLEQLHEAHQQLETVSREAGTIAERERIARDIHDTLAQDLVGLVLLTQQAAQETDPAIRSQQLALLETRAREALTETRALVAGATPPTLADGLIPALQRLTARFAAETEVHAETHILAQATLPSEDEVVLLRCAQEALANVRKHAGATRATVTLEHRSITIADNGCGFTSTVPHAGMGLPGMRDRLALVGGTLTIHSDSTGTTLTAHLGDDTA